MKRLLTLTLLTAMVVPMCGCLAPGRYRGSLVDLDLRTPEQIMADEAEAAIVFTGEGPYSKTNPATARSPLASGDGFIEVLTVTKGRLRLFSFEADVYPAK
jgi:hypothetical protein